MGVVPDRLSLRRYLGYDLFEPLPATSDRGLRAKNADEKGILLMSGYNTTASQEIGERLQAPEH
jgi:hypothetical protein